jgi:hypothetical protein
MLNYLLKMKKVILLLPFVMMVFVASANADMPIRIADLPKQVVASLEKHFPGSKMLYAEKDGGFHLNYEVYLKYHGRHISVEVLPDGHIIDVDNHHHPIEYLD